MTNYDIDVTRKKALKPVTTLIEDSDHLTILSKENIKNDRILSEEQLVVKLNSIKSASKLNEVCNELSQPLSNVIKFVPYTSDDSLVVCICLRNNLFNHFTKSIRISETYGRSCDKVLSTLSGDFSYIHSIEDKDPIRIIQSTEDYTTAQIHRQVLSSTYECTDSYTTINEYLDFDSKLAIISVMSGSSEYLTVELTLAETGNPPKNSRLNYIHHYIMLATLYCPVCDKQAVTLSKRLIPRCTNCGSMFNRFHIYSVPLSESIPNLISGSWANYTSEKKSYTKQLDSSTTLYSDDEHAVYLDYITRDDSTTVYTTVQFDNIWLPFDVHTKKLDYNEHKTHTTHTDTSTSEEYCYLCGKPSRSTYLIRVWLSKLNSDNDIHPDDIHICNSCTEYVNSTFNDILETIPHIESAVIANQI